MSERSGSVTLSKGTIWAFTTIFSIITTIGGFGLYEMRGFRADLQSFRDNTRNQFNEMRQEINVISTQQAVMVERMDMQRVNQQRIDVLENRLRQLELDRQ